jgi:thymidylate synthase (FAD)
MEKVRIDVLNNGFVELVDYMGSDLSIVNAARVSTNKHVEEFTDKDEGLIKYLVNNKHETPFRHAQITLHIKAPIFVLRQLMRHNIGITYSEKSGRYVEFDPEDYFYPAIYREQAENVKQGSGKDIVDFELWGKCAEHYGNAVRTSIKEYQNLLELGVSKELARCILPISIYSEVQMTASLQALIHIIKLREDTHAQLEIQKYAHAIKEIITPLYPISCKYFLKEE